MIEFISPMKTGPKKLEPVGKILKQCRSAFWFAFALTFAIDTLSITPMLYMWNTYDRVLPSRSGVTLVSLTLIVIAFYVFWSALEWIRSRLLVRLSLRLDWELAADVFDASFRRYVGRKNVNVHQLLGDLLALRQFFTGQPVLILMDVPFAFVFVGIAAIFHPYLAMFTFVSVVVLAVTAYFTARVTGPILKDASEANSEATQVAMGSLRHAESTYALGMMEAVRNRWYELHRVFLTNQVNASEATGLVGGISGFLQKTLPSLQITLGVYLAMENLITGGMVVVAGLLIGKAVSPIQKLISSWREMVNTRLAYDRLNKLLAEDEAIGQQMSLPPPRGRVDVQGAFAVPPGHDKAVLHDLNFSLNAGEILAIVGPSAAGKSSLVRLLLGIWKPYEGHVRLDGVEIADWNHDEVGPLIGYVPQEIGFFEGTIADNIARLGEVDPIKVVQAAMLVGMHTPILALPNGYDTNLGETGFALSGGQRQRIAIARAIYGLPKYVVMDEPNSNLDDGGENALIDAIRAMRHLGTTVILTTHRPKLVGVADKMLVLKGGHQVAFGTVADMFNAMGAARATPPSVGS